MTETTQATGPSSFGARLRGWFRIKLISIVFVVIGMIIGFFLGWSWSVHVVESAMARAMQFKSDNDRLQDELSKKTAEYSALEARYARMQSAMESMVPSPNTYSINPNQSVTVADGRLTIGLVGLPTYENVMVNINGKQQAMAVGDTAAVTVGSSRCEVWVQSFDMFKATFIAKCEPEKPQ